MNTLKMFQLAVLITVLSVLTGCSDHITSSGNSDEISYSGASKIATKQSVDENVKSDILGSINKKVVTTQIRLKPYRSFTFNYGNTGLRKITDFRVENLNANPEIDSDVCGKLKISGKNNTEKQILSCESAGFNLKEIVVSNQSPEFLDLEVILCGFALNRLPNEKESE